MQSGLPRIYLATSRVYDAEMQAKVDDHIADRGEGWVTIEEPIDVTNALRKAPANHAILVDCATMWLTNLVMDDLDVDAHVTDLIDALAKAAGPVVVVSNEVGLGIVPDNALSRRFRQLQGRLNAQIAAQADTAALIVAGLPLWLKGSLA